jgi:hypothetical protein
MLNPLLTMLSQSYQHFSRKIRRLCSHTRWAFILLLLAFCVSCSPAKSPDIDLKFSVEPGDSPGLYSVTGNTNIRDRSRIVVTAIRYLRSTNQELVSSDPKATYSILDRKIAEVANGKWQATLNLWKVSPDGRLQEPWQLRSSQTGFSLKPANEVSFLATFDPAAQPPKLQQKEEQIQDLRGSLVRFTAEGLPYVQASQALQLGLPVGKRPPPKLQPEDINWGWGNRFELGPEPPVASSIPLQQLTPNQTKTPLLPSEFVR